MNEGSPADLAGGIENEPQALTEKEKADVAAVWEKLGSGRKLPEGLSVAEMREQMWRDCKATYMEDVLPTLEFNQLRNLDLEQRIKDTERSPLRASLERQLVRQYVKTLSKMAYGWGTTPALTLQTEGTMNCVGATGFLAAYIEASELNMGISCAQVAGHHVVMLSDSEGRNWYADARNNVFGEITATGETTPGGVSFYLNEKDQQNIGFPYRKLVSVKPADGFIHSNLNNFACIASNFEGYPGEQTPEMQDMCDKNKGVLELQDWWEIGKKLIPTEVLNLIEHNDEWAEEKERIGKMELLHEEARSVIRETMVEVFGNKDLKPAELEEISNRLHSSFVGFSDQVVNYFTQNTDLPAQLPENATHFLRVLHQKFSALNEKPELKKYLLGMISSWVHRIEE